MRLYSVYRQEIPWRLFLITTYVPIRVTARSWLWLIRTVLKSITMYVIYSSSHIIQITDFVEFLHEYCKEKSKTCAKFWTSFFVTKNIKICFRPATPVKNQHKMHYHGKLTCIRDITLADPGHKIVCSLGYKYLLWKFLLQNIFYSSSASFSCKLSQV